MIARWRPAPLPLAALLTLAVALPAAAQVSSGPGTTGTSGTPDTSGTSGAGAMSDRPPGWSVTPAIGVSEMWDDNPTLAAEGDVRTGDLVTAVRPSFGLGYRGRRTTLRSDYNGTFDFYRELSGQDRRDHRAGLDFTHQLTRQVQLFARDQAMLSPTTADAAQIGATVLRQQTTRMNAFRGGFEALLGRQTTLNATYASQWIQFARDDESQTGSGPLAPLPPSVDLLQGGHSHGGVVEVRHRVNPRFSFGADYEAQRAIVAGGTETFDVHSALAVSKIALGPSASISLAYGHAWLTAGQNGFSDDGAAFNLGVDWQGRHSGGGLHYSRAFLPSFGFGGTFQNEELRASLRTSLTRWVQWTGSLAVSNNDPLEAGDPSLKSVSAMTSLGWIAKRWLQLDTFVEHVSQNSRLAGGHVLRTRAGVQATVSQTVRATR